jgi:chemotaxis response regulator CheB
MREIRALIVDDEPLARRGIRQLLERHPDIVVAGEANDGREAVRAMREERPDIVFLDVQMPELDGFGVLREIGAANAPVMIFVTAFDTFAPVTRWRGDVGEGPPDARGEAHRTRTVVRRADAEENREALNRQAARVGGRCAATRAGARLSPPRAAPRAGRSGRPGARAAAMR